MPRSQQKLFAALAVLVLLAVLFAGWIAERAIRNSAEVGAEASIAALRGELAVLGVIALGVALAVSYVLWRITLEPIRHMRRVAGSIARGELDSRLPLQLGDELGGIALSLNDIADQLRGRLADATAEKERLGAVLNGMAEGVLVLDVDGRVVLANQRLGELFDSWGDVFGRRPIEAIRNPDLEALLLEARRVDEPVVGELVVGRAAPRTLRVHAIRYPATGARLGTVAVFHDVTEFERLESVRRDFVANASHELRTPLAAIQGFAETLLSNEELSETDRRSYLGIIDRHARRLGNLVADLLELTTVEGSEAQFDLGSVDISALARALLSEARARFEQRDLDVRFEGAEHELAWADPQAVEQVLINLLDNAAKYTEEGGRIELHVSGDERRVRVEVADTGIGIPEGDLGRIFERFYRVDKARSRALGGTGLGLSIVKHLVQRLGGEISVESALGRGSTFSVTLPRAKPADAADA